MSSIKSKNTNPEVKLRKALWEKGYRYLLHKDLPGKPDLVLKKYNLVIFIDGCFWHKCPEHFQYPKTNKKFWKKKINKNVKRDKKINSRLTKDNWTVFRIWEHEIKSDINTSINKIEHIIINKDTTKTDGHF